MTIFHCEYFIDFDAKQLNNFELCCNFCVKDFINAQIHSFISWLPYSVSHYFQSSIYLFMVIQTFPYSLSNNTDYENNFNKRQLHACFLSLWHLDYLQIEISKLLLLYSNFGLVIFSGWHLNIKAHWIDPLIKELLLILEYWNSALV